MILDNVSRNSIDLFYTFLKIRLDLSSDFSLSADCCLYCHGTLSFSIVEAANFTCDPRRTQIKTHAAKYNMYKHTHLTKKKKLKGVTKMTKVHRAYTYEYV